MQRKKYAAISRNRIKVQTRGQDASTVHSYYQGGGKKEGEKGGWERMKRGQKELVEKKRKKKGGRWWPPSIFTECRIKPRSDTRGKRLDYSRVSDRPSTINPRIIDRSIVN